MTHRKNTVTCADFNDPLCVGCIGNQRYGSGPMTCWIEHFRLQVAKNYPDWVKEYLVELIKNDPGGIPYLRRAIEYYYPEHLDTLDKLLVLK